MDPFVLLLKHRREKHVYWQVRPLKSPIHAAPRGVVVEAAIPNLEEYNTTSGTRSVSFQKPFFVARSTVTSPKDIEKFAAELMRRGYTLTPAPAPVPYKEMKMAHKSAAED